jgi:hypothetical protein
MIIHRILFCIQNKTNIKVSINKKKLESFNTYYKWKSNSI